MIDREPMLEDRLRAAYSALGPDYVPRTAHLGPDGRARFVNRLIEEPSPYLRQHAHNPVDWRPWGEAAFAEATARDLPLFLSVGYATCHWCHVMEEESFDDIEVAEVLNAQFIPVKLDREQRPDLDQIYITATQIQHDQAGWPNSVWLTPDARPFHTGTYFPKPHFLQTLRAVSTAWEEKREEVEAMGAQLAETIRGLGAAARGAEALGAEANDAAARAIMKLANAKDGGFSLGMQFPQEGYILFLLDHWRRTGEGLAPALAALDGIAAGGIHDHVGGGFHRYATDVNWRTPHFEKMLYNQALLSRAYVQAWEATGRPAYRRAAERCFAYVLRDMTAPGGALYAAEDADNLDAAGKREEGEFYTWTPDQARAALGDADFAIAALGLEEPPTLEAGPVAHLRPGAAVDFAALDPVLERLRLARDARNRPIRDEKVIAGWNGLMIRAFAEGGRAFGRADLIAAAARAYDDAMALLTGPTGLCRIAAGGERREAAGLEDHAWLGLAALALWDATGEGRWLEAAERQAAELSAFDNGDAMKMTRADGPLGPVADTDDGAVPSGQSSALELLARLDRRAPRPERRARAGRLAGALSGSMGRQPIIRTLALTASAILRDGETEMRRVAGGGAARVQARRAGRRFTVTIELGAGWKVAADTLTLAGCGAVEAPAPTVQETAPGLPQEVHQGAVTLTAAAPETGEARLTLQLCDAATCRLPEVLIFRLQ